MNPFISVAIFFAILTILVFTVPAQAHSWYPWACCHDKDCHPTAAKVVPGGYLLPDGRFIKEEAARPSQDGGFHICETPQHVLLCFFAPRTGV